MKRVLSYLMMAAFVVLTAFFTACSSPESDGIKVAKKGCDCERVRLDVNQKAIELYISEYSKFIKDFNSYNFSNRVDFISKYQEINDNIIQKNDESSQLFSDCLQKAEEYYRKESEKYATNQEKKEQFEYARRNYRCEVKNEKIQSLSSQHSDLNEQIKSLKLSIIPPIPDIEKIKNDLRGHTIKSGYFNAHFNHRDQLVWKITPSDEFNEIEILNVIPNEDCIFEVRFRLQGRINQFVANVSITFVLRDYNDWSIAEIQTKSFDIVSTGKYDSSFQKSRNWMGAVYFSNISKEHIFVLGELKNGNKYSMQLEAGYSVGICNDCTFDEYKILFIELLDGFSFISPSGETSIFRRR